MTTSSLIQTLSQDTNDSLTRAALADLHEEAGNATQAQLERARAAILDPKNGRLRGSLCRIAGALRVDGRPISTVRFDVIEGDEAPDYEGHSYHFETKGGRRIDYPNAYKRVARSAEIVYCPASHVVTVGAEWLLAYAAKMFGKGR